MVLLGYLAFLGRMELLELRWAPVRRIGEFISDA